MRTQRLLITVLALGVLALVLRPLQPSADASRVDSESNIAVCAVPTIVNELMASDRFAEERNDLADEFEEKRQELEQRMEEIRDQAQDMDPEDPAMPQMQQEFFELRNELFEMQSEFQTASSRLQAEHLAACYELARTSAIGVGEDLGYDFVIASGSPDEDLNTQDTQQLLGQLSRRPVLLFPEEHDITDDVRDDLNL